MSARSGFGGRGFPPARLERRPSSAIRRPELPIPFVRRNSIRHSVRRMRQEPPSVQKAISGFARNRPLPLRSCGLRLSTQAFGLARPVSFVGCADVGDKGKKEHRKLARLRKCAVIYGRKMVTPQHIENLAKISFLAERGGFEPPIGLHLCRISSAVRSTTLPPLQGAKNPRSPAGGWASSRRGWRARQAGRGTIPQSVARQVAKRGQGPGFL
ncbi:MAG: hypothetical protein JWR89_3301 [Tardiphaga sp.]|jgi:hypothetical protein|nr:hypothetical protein [Tardiphaga sp.]